MNYYFITGTSSGIGKALVENLLHYSHTKIIGLSRTNTIEDNHFTHHKVDLSKINETETFQFPKLKSADRICLVNNAGTLGDIDFVGKQDTQNIVDSMQVNFTSAAILMNKFIKKYQEQHTERIIINISSGAANSAYEGWANYCSAKSALNMFTKVIVKEQMTCKHPIKAYAVAPGVVDTVMQSIIRETDEEKFKAKEKFVQLKQAGQLYKAHDVAKKLTQYLHHPSEIPSIVSRINLP